MHPKWHVLFGFIFSYILVYFFNFSIFQGTIIFLSSLLIDIDHYFYYVYKTRMLSPIYLWKWDIKNLKNWRKLNKEEKKNSRLSIFIFHGIEFWLIIIVLGFYSSIFWYALLGFAIHMLADFPDMIYNETPIYLKISPLYVYVTNKNK